MTCDLLDVGCHVQSAAWEWWADVSILNKALIVLGLLGVILGCSWGLLKLIKAVGGWPAVIGFVVAALGLVLALLPRKLEPAAPKPVDEFAFGVDRVKRKKKPKRKTLRDVFAEWRP